MIYFYLSLIEDPEESRKMTEIYEKYKYKAHNIARGILQNEADAEDAVQTAFIEIIQHKDKYLNLPSSELVPLLVVIVKSKALNIIRSRKKMRVEPEEALIDVVDDGPDIADLIVTQEDYALLRKAIKMLIPSYENIINLKYFLELSNSEIADELGISKKNAEITMYRARQSLAEKFLGLKGGSDETDDI